MTSSIESDNTTTNTGGDPATGSAGRAASSGRPASAVMGHLRSQFGRPRGPLGVVAGRIMSSRGSNVDRNHWLIELLGIEPHHRVLELGPGPGIALAAAADAARYGHVVGVDHSSTMLRMARRRVEVAVADGRVRLIEGRAEHLPNALLSFDRIYCMNVWLFWEDQEAVIAELVRRLIPGGRLSIGYQPRFPGATAADTTAAGRCLRDQLSEAGLIEVDQAWLEADPVPVVAVSGTRPTLPSPSANKPRT